MPSGTWRFSTMESGDLFVQQDGMRMQGALCVLSWDMIHQVHTLPLTQVKGILVVACTCNLHKCSS